ncbi:MAG: hypothetical protein ACLPHE_07530 [Methanobacterium sp.]
MYLKDIFLRIIPELIVDDMNDKEVFVKFLKKFMLIDKYLESFSKFNGNNYPISELIPKRIDFQQKEKLKIAYKMLGIDLKKVPEDKVWNNIFDKKTGYIAKRHKIIHSGVVETLISRENLDINLINEAILDICNFVYELDKEIVSKYRKDKYRNLYWIKAQ